MIPRTTLHGSGENSRRAREALDIGLDNRASRDFARAHASEGTPAPVGTRAQLAERVGVTDPAATNDQILAAVDAALAAAKAAQVVVPPVVDAADALYAAAWGVPAAMAGPTQTRATTEADALAVLTWANAERGA